MPHSVRVASHSSWLQARSNAALWLSAAPRGINVASRGRAARARASDDRQRASGRAGDAPGHGRKLIDRRRVRSNPYRGADKPATNRRFCEQRRHHKRVLVQGATLTLPSRPIWDTALARWAPANRPTGASWGGFP
jgi:hypothetical protein